MRSEEYGFPTYFNRGGISVGKGVTLDCPNISFGKNVSLCPNVRIFGLGKLYIGDNTCIGDGTVICVAENITIGNDTMIAAQCYITDCNHGMHVGAPMRTQPIKIKHTHIGSDVWIGCNCSVLAGADLCDGVVLGAGTTIDCPVAENTIIRPDRNYVEIQRR